MKFENRFVSKVCLGLKSRDLLLIVGTHGGSSGIAERRVLVFDVSTGRERISLSSQSHVVDAAFSPDGARIATLAAEGPRGGLGKAVLWDAQAGRELLRLPTETTGEELRFSPMATDFSLPSAAQAAGPHEFSRGPPHFTKRRNQAIKAM